MSTNKNGMKRSIKEDWESSQTDAFERWISRDDERKRKPKSKNQSLEKNKTVILSCTLIPLQYFGCV